ncbi:protein ripply3 isoform X2 [Amia ocellicauda]|uniref:protein ripply3 isoform X2 n=1 Tax=Amia ocellicauda TaxID=2972642 RepID=UPI003463F77D
MNSCQVDHTPFLCKPLLFAQWSGLMDSLDKRRTLRSGSVADSAPAPAVTEMLPGPSDVRCASCTVKAPVMHPCQCCTAVPTGLPKGDPDIWRPWVLTNREVGLRSEKADSGSATSLRRQSSKGALGFQHPVRLYMPKSKTQEYLCHMGEKVLASFPVQATMHFYNDDTDSEEEEEEEMAELLRLGSEDHMASF